MKRSVVAFAAVLWFWQIPVARADLILQLKATDYNTTTNVWLDSSGKSNDALRTAGNPTLVTIPGQLNGSPAVHFDGGTYFTLESPLWQTTPGAGYTAIVVLRATAAGPGTILGGTDGNFQYRIGGDGFDFHQEALVRNIDNIGHGNAALSPAGFNVIGVAVNSAGSAFSLNGAADGTGRGSFFNVPSATNLIGVASSPSNGVGEFFVGDIAEIRVYNTPLSASEIATIETQLLTTYAVPEPGSLLTLAVVAAGMFAVRCRWKRPAIPG